MPESDALSKVRWKVERGDRLSDDELGLLQKAVTGDPSLSLRLTLAHALVNNELGREALLLADRLVQDHPDDAQVLMLKARVLVGLEQWADAEPLLRRAVAKNPDDLEALKALAMTAMRRGEGARARAWMKNVLERDPFDSEAQWIQAELDATQGPPLDLGVSLQGFTRALVERLEARSAPHLVQKNTLLLKPPGQSVVRVSLESLYQSFVEGGRALEATVEAMARELTERAVGLPPGQLVLLGRVLPVLRDGRFLERSLGALKREGPAGLWFFYVLFDPDFMRYLPEGVAVSHGLGLEQVDAAAWKNLDARPADPSPIELVEGGIRLASGPTGLWALAKGDGHDAARLLSPLQQAALEQRVGPQPWRVYLGLRELVLVCSASDAANVELLSGLSAAPDGIEGAFAMRDGRLHPLAEWAGLA